MKELTDREKRFCDEYLKDLVGTKAAIRAGYSQRSAEVQASRMLSKANIRGYIEQQREKIRERTIVTVEYVIDNLKKVLERSMEAEPVVDKEGNETGIFKFEAHAANRSLELLGKHIGMFSDKLQIDKTQKTELTVHSTNDPIEASKIYQKIMDAE